MVHKRRWNLITSYQSCLLDYVFLIKLVNLMLLQIAYLEGGLYNNTASILLIFLLRTTQPCHCTEKAARDD